MNWDTAGVADKSMLIEEEETQNIGMDVISAEQEVCLCSREWAD